MEIEQEIQNLIEEYIKKVEEKESDLISFKEKIGEIISGSEKEFTDTVSDLDNKFELNDIGEEEYLTLIREKKEMIFNNVKEKLDSLVSSLG